LAVFCSRLFENAPQRTSKFPEHESVWRIKEDLRWADSRSRNQPSRPMSWCRRSNSCSPLFWINSLQKQDSAMDPNCSVGPSLRDRTLPVLTQSAEGTSWFCVPGRERSRNALSKLRLCVASVRPRPRRCLRTPAGILRKPHRFVWRSRDRPTWSCTEGSHLIPRAESNQMRQSDRSTLDLAAKHCTV
jgi:hypothetical protein